MSRILSVVGLQNSGKTMLVQNMIKQFKQMELTVAVIKHDGHVKIDARDDWEKSGSDTEKCVDAGASYTMIVGGGRSLLRTMGDSSSTDVESLCRRVLSLAELNDDPVDVLLVEGFKKSSLPKIAVLRHESDIRWIQGEDVTNLLAVMCSPLLRKDVGLGVRMYDETQVDQLCIDVSQGLLS